MQISSPAYGPVDNGPTSTVGGTGETDTTPDYYAPITATGGDALLGQIHDLITATHRKYTSYEDCKNLSYVTKTDKGTAEDMLIDFYTQQNISMTWDGTRQGTWNREHVWCKSLSNGLWKNGNVGAGSDLHHIRPSEYQLNATRGNLKFGEFADSDRAIVAYFIDADGTRKYQGGLYTGSKFEPLDEVKGDVARIVMYVYAHYNTFANVHGTTNGGGESAYFGSLDFTHVIAASSEAAAIELLVEWNKADPVDEIEIARNDAVYDIQGNRNPFIDHPEYVQAVWGGNN